MKSDFDGGEQEEEVVDANVAKVVNDLGIPDARGKDGVVAVVVEGFTLIRVSRDTQQRLIKEKERVRSERGLKSFPSYNELIRLAFGWD